MDYLLGKDKDREGARLLSGDPELTKRLSDSLSFQNRHTVGVLSFEEANLPDDHKRAIRESFESCLLAGLEKDQYNITWIEHTDKDRLELNFVIANTELTTGKRLQPYYDKVDRPLVENWKQVTNHEYHLTDPHDPDKAQAVKTLSSQNLPQDIRKIKEQIGQVISHQIEQGNVTDRKDVIDTLQQAGFEIARQTDKSISIKNPDGKRNIRLEGIIYENRQFNEEFREERRRARKDYAGTGAERYRTALNKLQYAIEVKQERNRASFGREYQTYQREQNRLATGIGMENDARGLMGVLLTVFLILLAMNLWTGFSLKNKKAELAEITEKIEQSPVEQRLLAKITVVDWSDEKGGLVVIPRSKAIWETNQNKEQALFIKK